MLTEAAGLWAAGEARGWGGDEFVSHSKEQAKPGPCSGDWSSARPAYPEGPCHFGDGVSLEEAWVRAWPGTRACHPPVTLLFSFPPAQQGEWGCRPLAGDLALSSACGAHSRFLRGLVRGQGCVGTTAAVQCSLPVGSGGLSSPGLWVSLWRGCWPWGGSQGRAP